ncbi:hypothetical protein ACO0RG_004044 [Hanseniaspora osmophila]|uniref:Uncharacterized protein n=1 Tax=Hanseniaspora osmophila TaxID=56408 RepID=A0A1E5RAX3_9ASCO|nr:hypothetical protein AWRI3579_g2676 [Hanseniaspora osmophila]
MSNLLDKSLDEIIGSRKTAKKTPQRVGRSSRTNNNGNTRSATKVSSKAVGVRKRAPVARNPAAVNSKRVAKIVDRTVNSFGSNRISIEGMPRDIKRESIRVCI